MIDMWARTRRDEMWETMAEISYNRTTHLQIDTVRETKVIETKTEMGTNSKQEIIFFGLNVTRKKRDTAHETNLLRAFPKSSKGVIKMKDFSIHKNYK
jgi:hypothetical protein